MNLFEIKLNPRMQNPPADGSLMNRAQQFKPLVLAHKEKWPVISPHTLTLQTPDEINHPLLPTLQILVALRARGSRLSSLINCLSSPINFT